MWADFGNPHIKFIEDESHVWPPDYAVVKENYTKDSWVYMVVAMNSTNAEHDKNSPKQIYIPGAHPMHIHGHDLVVLAQHNSSFEEKHLTDGTFQYDNPPRRDTALLPANGYLAFGFQLDNPGIWIFHCHIAWHASSGLGLTIIERQSEIKLSRSTKRERDRLCANWDAWHSDDSNWWDAHEFQDDSGV